MILLISTVMAIISVSLGDKLLEEIDALKDEIGFSGRSEIFRASTRLLIADNDEKKEFERPYSFHTHFDPSPKVRG
nr:ribbon-helix-helix protein, CopG family [Methanobacterium formicicum]